MLNIIQTPSPNFNERPCAIDSIIIHYTDMVSHDAALAWLINPTSQVSAHYLIDEGGQVYQMVNQEHRAWHAGESYWQGRRNLNDCSIGIELANPGHSHGYTPFPEAQIDALIELCLEIKEKWNIPGNRILGHSDIAPQRKQDPGHLFPWEKLAKQGLGIWPVGNMGAPHKIDAEEHVIDDVLPMTTEDLQTRLSQLGYDITSPSHALLAFQRHFQPHKVDGIADAETYVLLKKII